MTDLLRDIEAPQVLGDNDGMLPFRSVQCVVLSISALWLLSSGCGEKKGADPSAPDGEPVRYPAEAEPAPGEFPKQGPGDGPDRPVNAGPNASESCVRRGSSEGPSVLVSGMIDVSGEFPRGTDGRFLVMAMDQRVDTLDANRVLEVYGVVAVDQPHFELSFPAPARDVWLCAVGPASLGGVEYFSHMGCATRPLLATELKDGSPPPQQIDLRRGLDHLGLVGLSQFDTRVRDGKRVRRTIRGKIETDGAPSSHFIAAAAVNVLAGSDVAEDPRVVGAVRSGEEFQLSYLAVPGEQLWICAIALPPDGKTAYDVDSLAGAGCQRFQFPSGNEPLELDGVVHRVNSGKPVPLTPHEREHYTMLQRCFLE